MLCILFAGAQNKGTGIMGMVKNIEGDPISSASVFLIRSSDSSVVKFTITNSNGCFWFISIPAGTYYVNITLTGYKKVRSNSLVYNRQGIKNFGPIRLQPANNLNEIVITDNKDFIENKAGKMTLNIQNSILAVGNTALEILKRAPGVQIDNNDNISLNGKSDVLIMIDNKPTYVSGTTLSDLLQSTQSSMIDKIELISNPNSGYDAAGTGGVINIKLKRDKTLGSNAQFTAGIGDMQPAGGHDSKTRANAAFNFNYRSKNLDIFGAYAYSDVPVDKMGESDRLLYNGSIPNLIDVSWFSSQRRITNAYRIGVDYNVDRNNIIGFLVNGSLADLSGMKNTVSTISHHGVIDSTIQTKSNLTRSQNNFTLNLNYKGNFNKGGELTVDGDYIYYGRHYDELIQSSYFNTISNNAYRYLSLQNNSPSNYKLYVFNVNYHLTIDAANNFTAGIKSSNVKTDNDSNFGELKNGGYVPYPMFTDQFNYSEIIHAANVDYNHIFSKKLGLELGMRVEQTISDGMSSNINENVSNNYFDIFPNVQLINHINNSNDVSLTYSRRVTRPKYEDLNPFLSYSDQYTYLIGNPYLKPFYSNTIELTHVYKSRFITALTASVINGFSQVIYMQNDPQIITLKKVNLGNRYNYGIQFIEPVTFNKWYTVDFDLNMLYQRFTNTQSAGDLNSGSPDILLKIEQFFKLSPDIKAELFGTYETPTTFGIFRYKSNYYFNAGISKSILHKQAAILLRVDDIFNSDKNIYTTSYQNLNISGNQKNSYRLIYVSFTYALGSQSVRDARRRNTGAEDEQGRVGTGTN